MSTETKEDHFAVPLPVGLHQQLAGAVQRHAVLEQRLPLGIGCDAQYQHELRVGPVGRIVVLHPDNATPLQDGQPGKAKGRVRPSLHGGKPGLVKVDLALFPRPHLAHNTL